MLAAAQKQDVFKEDERSFDLSPFQDKPYEVLHVSDVDLAKKAAHELRTRGCVILRDFIVSQDLVSLQSAVGDITQKPSLAGSYGYYMKDCAKKLCDPFLISKQAVDLVAHETLLDCMAAYTGEEMILAEAFMKQDLGIQDVYFPFHADYQEGGFWAGNQNFPTSREVMQHPFAIGGILYLTDTSDGAFCYSEGTHNWGAPLGTAPESYPQEVQQEIRERNIRVDGKAGDLVIFDDRGFHGPEQPTKAERTVIIFDYTKKSTFGKTVKAPMPILVPYLSGLSQRQLQALGVDCDINVSYQNHHIRQFQKHQFYRPVKMFFEILFGFDRKKRQLRNFIKGQKHFLKPKIYKN